MEFSAFIEKIKDHYNQRLPFVMWSEANAPSVQAYLQQDDILHTSETLSENGFVLAPFDNRLPTVRIPKSTSEVVKTTVPEIAVEKDRVVIFECDTARREHLGLVGKTIATIFEGKAEKIVVSRIKDFDLFEFSLETLISRLFAAYPTAYRYVWFHPETGMWCGATPEVLVDVKDNRFQTMALAGTQPFKEGAISWRKKELEEQDFVTQAILDNLKPYVEAIQTSKVQTVRAGTLLHLKTDIEAVMKKEPGVLAKIVRTMHPTPAVCGTPQEFSRDFIIENEHYTREYYTGFFGVIDDNGASAALRVNLRCMKIVENTAYIMVGGGVTIDSNVEEEWNETQNKMQTMLQVLRPML